MLALLKDIARFRQTDRRSTEPPTFTNDLLNSCLSSSNVAAAAAGLADTTRSRLPDISETDE